MSDMSNVLSEAVGRMEKSLDVLKTDLQKIRTGRAHPSILEHIEVDFPRLILDQPNIRPQFLSFLTSQGSYELPILAYLSIQQF